CASRSRIRFSRAATGPACSTAWTGPAACAWTRAGGSSAASPACGHASGAASTGGGAASSRAVPRRRPGASSSRHGTGGEGEGAKIACVPVGPDTPRRAFDVDGWFWSGRGVTVLRGREVPPLPVTVLVPDGDYRVDAASVAIQPPPWLSGFARWRRRSFLPDIPTGYTPLGTFRADAGRLSLAIPADAGRRRHVIRLRLPPLGA